MLAPKSGTHCRDNPRALQIVLGRSKIEHTVRAWLAHVGEPCCSRPSALERLVLGNRAQRLSNRIWRDSARLLIGLTTVAVEKLQNWAGSQISSRRSFFG